MGLEKPEILLPGEKIITKVVEMNMTLAAFRATAKFVLNNPIKPGDYFNIEASDGKVLRINFK